MKCSKIYKLHLIFRAMPYVSDAQRKYFHANKAKLEAKGVDVSEWDSSSKGKDLPEHAKKKKKHDFAGDHLKQRHASKK